MNIVEIGLRISMELGLKKGDLVRHVEQGQRKTFSMELGLM